jgi:hypothetical protein
MARSAVPPSNTVRFLFPFLVIVVVIVVIVIVINTHLLVELERT